jgi:HEPN domain-containing protein
MLVLEFAIGYIKNMDAQEKYEYWLDIAQYDLETANAMLAGGRWLYVVFMCQQAVEKLIKGLYILYIDDNVPRLHNISVILKRFEDKLPFAISEDKYKFFNRLSKYYLSNRYPEYISKLSSQIIETEAKEILAQTKEEFTWLLTLHP